VFAWEANPASSKRLAGFFFSEVYVMSSDGDLSGLKKLLEGKTIAEVQDAPGNEDIAKFVLKDGTSFILSATELGWWITELPKKKAK
jgi:hypothetical protein